MYRMMKLVTIWVVVILLVSGCNSGGEETVDLPQTLTTPNQNASINFPEGWFGSNSPNSMTITNTEGLLTALPETLSNQQVYVYVDVIQNIVSGFGLAPDASLEEVLLIMIATDNSSVGDVDLFNDDDQPAVIVSGTIVLDGRTFGIIYALTNEDSTYGRLSLIAPEDEIDDYMATARSMIVTFDAEPPAFDQ